MKDPSYDLPKCDGIYFNPNKHIHENNPFYNHCGICHCFFVINSHQIVNKVSEQRLMYLQLKIQVLLIKLFYSKCMDSKPKLLLKTILLGEYGSGKTALWHRIGFGVYPYNNGYGGEFIIKKMNLKHSIEYIEKEHDIKLQTWDTSGQERFGPLGLYGAYYFGVVCAIIMYDITDKNSFDNIKIWMDELLEKCLTHKTSQKISIAIVGNKLI